MSIIEKALEKLDQRRPDKGDSSAPDRPNAPPAAGEQRATGRASDSAKPAASAAHVRPAPEPVDGRRKSSMLAESADRRRRVDPRTGIRQVELDREKLSRGGFVSPETADGIVAEQCRYIKRPLLLKAVHDEPDSPTHSNLIVVTSSVPGEGKTFTAVNLAMSMAMEIDRRVLLVDADVMKPDVCRVLGVEAGRGLTDLLINPKLRLEDVLLETDVEGLTLLPSGQHHSHVTEFFASAAMRELLEGLSVAYDIVIFDSMPLLARSGSSVLAGLVGQVVFVVEALRTPRGVIQEALGVLDAPGKAALVLNKSRERHRSKYRYGYYYGRPRQ